MNDDEEYTGWFVEFINQWHQFAPGYNWRTFHLIKIEFEDDRIMGGVEATFTFLGLGIRVRYNYVETDNVEEIKKAVEEIKQLHPEVFEDKDTK